MQRHPIGEITAAFVAKVITKIAVTNLGTILLAHFVVSLRFPSAASRLRPQLTPEEEKRLMEAERNNKTGE